MSNIAAPEEIKTVFAYFGRTMYHTQCLEISIVNAFLLLDLVPKRRAQIESQEEWEALVNSYMSSQLEQTLGKMIWSLTNTVPIPKDVKDKLRTALAERNRLAHGYFHSRADTFCTSEGCSDMMDELSISLTKICEAGEALEQILERARQIYGPPCDGAAEAYASIRQAVAYDL